MLITYTLNLSHQQTIEVPGGATEAEIRQAIEDDVPKYLSIRTYEGVGDDAEYFIEEE